MKDNECVVSVFTDLYPQSILSAGIYEPKQPIFILPSRLIVLSGGLGWHKGCGAYPILVCMV